MYNEQLEQLIDAALADGELTEKEKQILFKKAQALGVDLDEFEMVLDARLVKLKKAEAEKAASSAPKSNKLGDVKKCPSCGAMVQSYQGICPECGYAFEGIDANSAVKELSNLLQKTSDQGQMEKLINNYPIPMEKASLLAFITWLRPQSTDFSNPLANAYYKKYTECINKIKVSFSNDKQLQPFIAFFQEDEKKNKKQKIVKLTLKNKWFWVGVAVLIIMILILKPKPINKSAQKTSNAMIEAIEEGDLKKAEQILHNFKGDGKYYPGPGIEALCKAYIKNGELEKAEEYADDDDEELLELLFNAYLNNKDYSNAEKFVGKEVDYIISLGARSPRIEKIIETMCKNGDKAEARSYLTRMKPEMKKDEERYAGSDGTKRYNDRIKAINELITSY